jgi:nicotinate-nucleotide adenylyltransferase
MRIALFGGSFNPVHNGHLAIAEAARDGLRLDRILLVPCARPPHKDAPDLAPGRDRLAMIRLALRGRRALGVTDIELRRPGPSYTIETVETLRATAGGRGGGARREFYLLVGADMLADLPRWREAGRLVRLVRVAAAARPGWSLAPIRRALARAFGPAFVRGLARRRFDAPLVDVSSTAIRRRARAGRPLRGLVPDAVAAYIRRTGLYRRAGAPRDHVPSRRRKSR